MFIIETKQMHWLGNVLIGQLSKMLSMCIDRVHKWLYSLAWPKTYPSQFDFTVIVKDFIDFSSIARSGESDEIL